MFCGTCGSERGPAPGRCRYCGVDDGRASPAAADASSAAGGWGDIADSLATERTDDAPAMPPSRLRAALLETLLPGAGLAYAGNPRVGGGVLLSSLLVAWALVAVYERIGVASGPPTVATVHDPIAAYSFLSVVALWAVIWTCARVAMALDEARRPT